MAQSALLEKDYQTPVEDEKNTPEAIAHRRRGSEIYSKVFETKEFNAEDIAALVSAPTASALTAVAEPETAPASAAAFASAPAVTEPIHKDLFGNIAYKDHTLVRTDVAETATAAPVAAPVAEPAYRPAERFAPEGAPAVPLAPEREEDEDLRPTQRTMETLQRAELYRQEFDPEVGRKDRVGFFASLSGKAKMALAIIAAAFVVAIALVCINTGIINSMKTDLAAKRAELDGLTEYSEQLNSRIEEVTDPAFIDDYAEHELGMTRS